MYIAGHWNVYCIDELYNASFEEGLTDLKRAALTLNSDLQIPSQILGLSNDLLHDSRALQIIKFNVYEMVFV